ncbi:MAG: GNAT family N-acetyltransferase [Halopseudomonas sp.]
MATDSSFRLLPPSMHTQATAFYRLHGSPMKVRSTHQVWVLGAPAITACVCTQAVVSREGHWLTSLFVDPALRKRGLAGQLLDQVRLVVDGPIWLFCRPELSRVYHRHGYYTAKQMPESLTSKLQRYRREKQLIALVNPG